MARRNLLWIGPLFILLLFALSLATASPAIGLGSGRFTVTGRLLDQQGGPVAGAHIVASFDGGEEAGSETESQEDGTWELELAQVPRQTLRIRIERLHFRAQEIALQDEDLQELRDTETFSLHDVVLERRITLGFWAAALVFLGMLILIALERLHSTTAALAGLSSVFVLNYIGGAFVPSLRIITLERALEYVNWEVIFLVMGMMILVAIIESTNIFKWMAFAAYRISRGRAWLLVLILMVITAIASATLDNFTTMLLMVPISMEIGLALGVNPLAFVIAEVMASNVAGISTLIGTPTNILIGAHADIGFTDFLVNQTVGVLLALVAMAGIVLVYYRKEWQKSSGGISPVLYERLKQNGRIRDADVLWKSLVVFAITLAFFIIGENLRMSPAVTALIGATSLLVWIKPDVHEMISAVDWTTLVFFMALFMLVGAIQDVGLISVMASAMGRLIGNSMALGIGFMVFGVGTLSTVFSNIPLAASMLPVADFLSVSVSGAAQNKALYYALSMGVAMGGNGFLISAEANLVTAGIAVRAGQPISFKDFLRIGLPVTYVTLAIGFLWLLARFVLFGG